MVLNINGLTLSLGERESLLPNRVASLLGLSEGAIIELKVIRRSIDARRSRPPRFVFLLVVRLAAGVGWHLLARDTPQKHPLIKRKELAHNEAGIPSVPVSKGQTVLPWSTILGSRDILFVSLSYFAYGYLAWIFFTWFFRYLNVARGMDLKAISSPARKRVLPDSACTAPTKRRPDIRVGD